MTQFVKFIPMNPGATRRTGIPIHSDWSREEARASLPSPMKCQNQLNDPFGRVGRRQDEHCAAVKTQLLAEGVSSPEAVDATTGRIRRSAWRFATIVIAVTVVIALVVPPWRGLVAVFGALASTWVSATAFRARLHLRRYRAGLMHLASNQGPDKTKTVT